MQGFENKFVSLLSLHLFALNISAPGKGDRKVFTLFLFFSIPSSYAGANFQH